VESGLSLIFFLFNFEKIFFLKNLKIKNEPIVYCCSDDFLLEACIFVFVKIKKF